MYVVVYMCICRCIYVCRDRRMHKDTHATTRSRRLFKQINRRTTHLCVTLLHCFVFAKLHTPLHCRAKNTSLKQVSLKALSPISITKIGLN